MIEITEYPLSPERVITKVRSSNCGCVVTYIGLIRDHSEGKPVLSVEYRDPNEEAKDQLQKIADEAKQTVADKQYCHIPPDRQTQCRRNKSGDRGRLSASP